MKKFKYFGSGGLNTCEDVVGAVRRLTRIGLFGCGTDMNMCLFARDVLCS